MNCNLKANSVRFFLRLMAVAALLAPLLASPARAQSLPLIRDAEIEHLMRVYTRDVFKAAGLSPEAVEVHLIGKPGINAFVAGGQRIFVFTGLLQVARTPNQVIGVLAHEAGHIAGGHLARFNSEMGKASNMAIVNKLMGAAAVIGGTATDSDEMAQGGWGTLLGGDTTMVKRNIIAYTRVQEASADQAAVRYLDKTGQSGRGMLELFQALANASRATARDANPYLMSHPMPLDRLRSLEAFVTESPNYDKVDSPALVLRHEMMQAKLTGLQSPVQAVYKRYPPADRSLAARYARAVAAVQANDLTSALPQIDSLIGEIPSNPYFWELKGKALLVAGRPGEAIAPLQQAQKLAPRAGLIGMQLAQAQLGVKTPQGARAALESLRSAQRTENASPELHALKAEAYGALGDMPRAELATAETAIRRGDRPLALYKAQAAMKGLKPQSPEWLRAQDIVTVVHRDGG